MPEIGGKSELVHATDNHAVWIIKDVMWENRRRILNIWSCRQFKMLNSCMKCVLTEKYIGDDLQPMTEQDTGKREDWGGIIWNVVCGPDRVFGDSSYCKVIQCVTSCRQFIVQCESSSNWSLPDSRADSCAVWKQQWSDDFVLCELRVKYKCVLLWHNKFGKDPKASIWAGLCKMTSLLWRL